jgi:hypothetical protein
MFTECSLNVHWMLTECSLNLLKQLEMRQEAMRLQAETRKLLQESAMVSVKAVQQAQSQGLLSQQESTKDTHKRFKEITEANVKSIEEMLAQVEER